MDSDQMIMTAVVLLVGIIIAHTISAKHDMAHFVPFNSYEVPPLTSEYTDKLSDIHDKFGTLVSYVNSQRFALSYHLDSLISTVENVLSSALNSTVVVSSVDKTTPFTMVGVIALDKVGKSVFKFERVDFIVNSMNPFLIEKIILTPNINVNEPIVQPLDDINSGTDFRIKNTLGLFYPYPTSYNDMVLTEEDVDKYNATVEESIAEEKLQKLSM